MFFRFVEASPPHSARNASVNCVSLRAATGDADEGVLELAKVVVLVVDLGRREHRAILVHNQVLQVALVRQAARTGAGEGEMLCVCG